MDVAARGHDLPSIHIPFPASLLIYPGGAIIVCVLYYLVPIPLLTWLLSRFLWRARLKPGRAPSGLWGAGLDGSAGGDRLVFRIGSQGSIRVR